MSIKENLDKIRTELPSHVTLIAVSKTKSADMIREAYEVGQRDFGENYVQELEEKHKKLPGDIRWHAIGHLQSNKVKYIAGFVHLIHGVDSFKLLHEINKQALKNNRVIDCLLQMHIAKEETKFGFDFIEGETLLNSEELRALQHIRIVGFMGMATNTDDMNEVRNEFKTLKSFFDKVAKLSVANCQLETLSMGMSSDYKIAIEEGSTMIRIGNSIFGERNYTK